jgi:hypothetical protein
MSIKSLLKRQIEVDLESFLVHGGVITVCPTKKPRKAEITFNLDKALFNRPERRGDSRRRSYVATIERTV